MCQGQSANSPAWHASANSGASLSSRCPLLPTHTPIRHPSPHSTLLSSRAPGKPSSHLPPLPILSLYTVSFHLLPAWGLFHPSEAQLDITLVKLARLSSAGICSELWAPTVLCTSVTALNTPGCVFQTVNFTRPYLKVFPSPAPKVSSACCGDPNVY